MRFISNGPDLPGDLLDARDEGQVIFFCGAGVSRAEAGGPSFRELADRVVTSLGSSKHSPARQLLAMADTIKPVPGVGGILPADRIFAMLEQEFPVADVRRAVAAALRPKKDVGLGPHRSLVDLSRAPDGTVRLITTNFDRVFELADPTLTPIAPPDLPDPARTGSLNGVIHLHGKVSADYTAPESPEFVLSSADFGRAYLADGWATAFMRALMDRYRIVFVGYSADDPPMQYLLEALQLSLSPGNLYAFQEGEASYASGLWRHKGVTAIPFNGFDALWQTLAAWAERARDPESWRKRIADMTTKGPRGLEPHERGQVAHLVSSQIGASVFAENEPVPPAEWLCAFDPHVRYDRCRPLHWRDPKAESFDPFDNYGLDGEIPPARDREQSGPTSPPAGSWSAFEAQPGERPAGKNQLLPSLRGPAARTPAALPTRLWRLARWFGRIAADPVAIWWASGQNALHPDVVFQVRFTMRQDGVAPEIRRAWQLLLAAVDEPDEEGRDRYDLDAEIKREGWSRLALMKLAEIERPRLTVRRPMTAPIAGSENTLRLVDADVAYPSSDPAFDVPPDYLLDHIDATRRNLVLATRLEEEVGGFALMDLSPLNPFERGPNEFVAGIPDLSSLMAQLAALVRRLRDTSPALATAEVASWHSELGIPFRNLRVWAASEPILTSADQASEVLLSLDDDVWESRLERDVLTAVKARWEELSDESRKRLEAITLAGPQPWDGVDPSEFEPYRINAILRRLYWIEREGIPVSFDLQAQIEQHRRLLPDWDARDAADQLDRSPSRGGWVGTDKSHSALLDTPLDELLSAARVASGRGRDFLTESRPFRGLVETRPVRALAALRRAAARGENWEWAWNDLFWSEARSNDGACYRCYLARRIADLPETVLQANLRAAAQWLTTHGKPVWEQDRSLYLATWRLLRDTIDRHPQTGNSSVTVTGGHDWITEAINSPAGRLADQLFDELGWSEGNQGPDDSLKERAAQLLSLGREPRAHAAAMLAMRTNWFYAHDPAWTQTHLLPLLEDKDEPEVADAARTGFLRQSRLPQDALLLRLKPLLLDMFTHERASSARRDNLDGIVLASWYRKDEDGERLLCSADLREALIATGEQQRLNLLRLVARWGEENQDYAAQTVAFLQEVWPRQLAARSPAASAALAQVALRAGDRMPEVTAAVLPVLETSAEPIDALPFYPRTKDDQIARFPTEHLAIFHAVLPNDAQLWPWGMSQVIESLAEIDTLKTDPRLSELRRRQARI